MSSRQPIPVPPRLKWREFRYRVLPLLTLGATSIAVVSLWFAQIKKPSLVGRAIAHKANVITPVSGKISSLHVEPFQPVSQGDVVAVVEPIGIRNRLSSLRLEIDLIRGRIEPVAERKRNAVSYYRLRLEWLQQRVALAASKVNLQRAQNELARDGNLFKAQVLSADQFDQTQKSVAALVAEVEEASSLVQELGEALAGLESLDALTNADPLNEELRTAMTAQEDQLREIESLSGPYALVAPISGKVTQIDRVMGETILDGDRVLSITAEEPTQLITYLRSPDADSLQTGQTVRVQTRGNDRRIANTEIKGISPQWESLSGGLNAALTQNGIDVDLGLPVLLTVPSELQLRPGELVDIFLSTTEQP